MATYSVQPRDRVFVKGYGFSSFAKNMGKNIGKSWLVNVVKTFLIMLKNLQQIHLKLLQKESFKKHQNNRIELQKFKKSQQNNSETVTNDYDEEIPKERYILRLRLN